MKYILLIFMLISFSCKEREYIKKLNKNNQDIETKMDTILEKLPLINKNGVIGISIYPNFTKKNSIELYNQDKSIYAIIKNDTLFHRNRKYSIFNDEYSTKILNSIAFFPDYGVWYMFAERDNENFKIFLDNGKIVFLPKDKRYSFESYLSFLMNHQIGLSEKSPLYNRKSTDSQIISNYKNYIYEVIELYDDDWIKLKLTDFIEPGDKPYDIEITGWTKWKNEYNLNVEFYYE